MWLKSKWRNFLLTIISLTTSGTHLANAGTNTAIQHPDPNQNPGGLGDRTNFCSSICKTNQNVHENLTEFINRKVTELKHSVTPRFETITGLVYDINRDVQVIAKNCTVKQDANVTPDCKAKTTLDTTLENKIQNLLDITENIQASAAGTNQLLDVIKNNVGEPRRCDPNGSIIVSSDKDLLEQVKIITSKVSDPDYHEKTILKSIENIISNKLTAMKIDLQNAIEESVEKNILGKITDMTKQINDKIDLAGKAKEMLELIEKMNQKLAALENTTLEKQIQNLLIISENIQTSVAKPNQGSDCPEKISTELKTDSSNPLCGVKLPSSVEIKSDIWQSTQVPAEDELDKYMVTKTGCTYRALEYDRYFRMPTAVPFDGSRFEWRGAVRARAAAYLGVWWPGHGYGYNIGQDDNTITSMYEWGSWRQLRSQFTPRVLSDDRYIAFYIKIQNGTLTFGKECESEPIFTYNITIARGQLVNMSLWPRSIYGAKYLHRCPATLRRRREIHYT